MRAIAGHCLAILISSIPAAAQAQGVWEKTLAAARQEGTVTVIGPPVASHREAILKFQGAFPQIRLEYSGLAPAQFDPRIQRERELRQYVWDVLITGLTSTTFTVQVPAGWYDPLKPALILPEVLDDRKWLGGFDAGFMDRGKKHTYGFALNVSRSIFINRDVVPEAGLQKAEDLLDPRWKGKIAWNDPRVRGAGNFALAHMRKVLGADFARKLLVDQAPVVTQDLRQLAEWVVRGRYPIGIGVSTTDIGRFQKEGVGLNVRALKLPSEAITPGWGGVMLMNRAPHPNAAKVFLNWLLGREAQEIWAKLGTTNSRRLDVPVGDPDRALDAKRLDSYVNLSNEENAVHTVDATKFAQGLVK